MRKLLTLSPPRTCRLNCGFEFCVVVFVLFFVGFGKRYSVRWGEAMVVGYALADKKVKSFIKPPLVEHTKSKGVSLVRVDMARPLEDQGPFDVVFHKHGGDSGEAWTQHLLKYKARHSSVVLVDLPAAIEKLQNRASMLIPLQHLRLPPRLGTCGIPSSSSSCTPWSGSYGAQHCVRVGQRRLALELGCSRTWR
jgi:hypothetical protein